MSEWPGHGRLARDADQQNHGLESMGTLYLVDASVYVFRAWYSMPDSFVSPEGHPTHAVYGYAGFLLTLLERARPSHIAVAFDESLTSSYRNEIFPDYKANREPAPEELKRQFQWCREITAGLGLAWYSDPRFEAGDLIGTLAASYRPSGYRVSFVTSDKDLAQLLGPSDELWDFARNRRTDYQGVRERFGVSAEQMADFLAITGDPIDNIPGIPGVGPKTASALLAHFGTLDELLARADEIAYLSSIRGHKTLGRRIRQHEAAARLARRLTGIHTGADCIRPPVDLKRRAPDLDQLDGLLDRLGFGRQYRKRARELTDAF